MGNELDWSGKILSQSSNICYFDFFTNFDYSSYSKQKNIIIMYFNYNMIYYIM
jgi:hypothetical protein